MALFKNEINSLSSYLEELQSKGEYWFLRQTALEFLQLSDNVFRKAAHRLVVKGKLKRTSWYIDALMGYLKQNYYVGLLTAVALQGVAHQQPMTFQVITDKPTRAITVGQVCIEFFYKKNTILFPPSHKNSIGYNECI